MKILRVLNNNVVLSTRADGTEVVLTGLGIGFHSKPGEHVDESKVQQVFVPENNRDTDNMGEVLSAIPPYFLDLAMKALAPEAEALEIGRASSTVIALADHLAMAVRRIEIAGEESNPLAAEVAHLYPNEHAASQRLLATVNKELDSPLPDSETTAIALHLVNAGFRSGDLAETYRMTGVFGQLFEVVDAAFDINVDQTSITAARFITHLRYFFVRAHSGKQLEDGMSVLMDSLVTSHPEAVDCAFRLGTILELRLGTPLSSDELAYLSLHVARLVSDAQAVEP